MNWYETYTYNFFEPQIDWFVIGDMSLPFYMGNVIYEFIDIDGVVYLN